VSAAAAIAVIAAGCGGGGSSSGTDAVSPSERQALESYVSRIEPLRLNVNKLLDGADPLLARYREHRLSGTEAQRRMHGLERRFAGYEARLTAIPAGPAVMVAAERAYVRTYVLEDVYLRALTRILPSRDWSKLPHVEHTQRRYLLAWRAQLAIQAARLHVALPKDIGIVGLGEITPSPAGES
jgi:hypothetical protein